MTEYLTTRAIRFQAPLWSTGLLQGVEASVAEWLGSREAPIRFAVTQSDDKTWHCEVDVHVGAMESESIFRFERRAYEDASSFNVVMLVPTGIGSRDRGTRGGREPCSCPFSALLRHHDYSPQRNLMPRISFIFRRMPSTRKEASSQRCLWVLAD